MESPLSLDEQQQAVLEIAPRGTFREDVARRLKEAGIEFTPGGNGSIYYLSLWNRPNGERWHINVALLFDKAGSLYQTRTADSTTSLVAGKEREDPRRPSDGGDAPDGRAHRTAGWDRVDDEPERVAFPGQGDAARRSTH